MQASVNTIVRNLFQRDSLQDVQEEQLEEYVKKYPYSSVGHLLLSKKRKEKGEDYTSTASLASLYINNPLWLHYFLEDGGAESAENAPAATTEYEDETSHVAEPVHSIETDVQVAIAPEDTINPGTDQEQQPVTELAPVEEKSPEISAPVVLEQPALPADQPKQTVQEEQDLVFEPYHTIDYFASQGIKLKAEDLAKDKFGRQLKSFTDWLRSMKRIAPVQDDQPLQPPTDDSIVRNAEESVETSEVETEAMAEVWIKQGKPARAIAIYNKLSLLNPSKSHYFAAKIEQLNA